MEDLQMEENMYTEENNYIDLNARKGMGIASIILGGFSILCCPCMGLGLIFGVVGVILSIICLITGTGSGKTYGIIGVILNGIGVLLGMYVLISIAMMLDWSNINAETINQLKNIDPNDEEALQQWLQQFFKVDISSYFRSVR